MKTETYYFPSSNGADRIAWYKWLPKGAPKGVVQFLHGMSEHALRYERFAEFLTGNGYAVFANDHLGHGKSAVFPGGAGYFGDKNGWDHLVRDAEKLRRHARREFPGIPYMMMGHSMGSFILRSHMLRFPGACDGVILCGSGWHEPLETFCGYALCKILAFFLGDRYKSEKIFGIMNIMYCLPFSPKSHMVWVTRDENEIRSLRDDELCGFAFTLSGYADMLRGMCAIDRKRNMRAAKDTPVLIISGGRDPVGRFGAGAKKLYRGFKDAGLKNVRLRIYRNARHELLFETNRGTVMRDILAWTETVTAAVDKSRKG